MRRKNFWPPLKDVQLARKPNFDNYLPRVAEAMRAQGMVSPRQLQHRIAWILRQPGMADAFELSQDAYKQVPNFIYKSTFTRRIGQISAPRAIMNVIAYALDSCVDDIFPAPNKRGHNKDIWDSVMAQECKSSFDQACENDIRDKLSRVLLSLSPRQEFVIRARFGLLNNHEHSLEEVAERMGLNRESVRRIESEALRKLKHPSRSKDLRKMIDLEPKAKTEKSGGLKASPLYKSYTMSRVGSFIDAPYQTLE